jgi:hypothetical protein
METVNVPTASVQWLLSAKAGFVAQLLLVFAINIYIILEAPFSYYYYTTTPASSLTSSHIR